MAVLRLGLPLGTHGSALAIAQAEWVVQRLRAAGVEVPVVPVHSVGDAFWALRAALDAHEVDGVVHSYRDLPTTADPRVVVAAVPERADPRDPLQMLPAPGQGALACECRADDLDTEHLLDTLLTDAGTRAAVTAERAMLAAVRASRGDVPVGALADVVEDLDDEGRVVLRLSLRGVAATADDDLLRSSATAPYSDGPYSDGLCSDGPYLDRPYSDGEPTDADRLGRQVAAELLSLDAGALGADSALRPGQRPDVKRVST